MNEYLLVAKDYKNPNRKDLDSIIHKLNASIVEDKNDIVRIQCDASFSGIVQISNHWHIQPMIVAYRQFSPHPLLDK